MAIDSGDYPLALTLADEAYQISQAIANLWGQAYSRISIGYVYWDRGQPDQAMAIMQECLRLGDLANYLTPQVLTRTYLAAVYGSLGAIEQGLEMIHLALAVAETHMPIFRPYVLTKLAQLHVWQGRFDEAEAAVEQGKKEFNRAGAPILFQVIFLAEAELAIRQGDYGRALAATDTLLTILSHSDLRVHIAEVLYLRGQIFGAMGQPETAQKTLFEARAAAEAVGSRRMLWQILFALSRIETDPGEATRLRQQAQEIVESIAGNVSDPELRASFLESAEVQELLTLSS
jgi:tetratricopeptide (TPR) repeat protein